jgi:hypothetical protein
MEEIYKGYKIVVEQDEFADDPRNWVNVGTMVMFHKKYNLPNEYKGGVWRSDDFNSWEEVEKEIKRQAKGIIILPVYMYDHGGISLKVGSFQGLLPQCHAEFDSGQVGFIYATAEDIRNRLRVKRITTEKLKKVADCLEGEVQTYSEYLSGDVWTSYVYESKKCEHCGHEEWEEIDGNGDIYGYNEAMSLAHNTIDRLAETQENKQNEN